MSVEPQGEDHFIIRWNKDNNYDVIMLGGIKYENVDGKWIVVPSEIIEHNAYSGTLLECAGFIKALAEWEVE